MSRDEDHTVDEHALREQVARSEQALEGLEGELAAVDAELEALAGKQQQYLVLGRVCESLEELDGLGASDLFWNGPAAGSDLHAQLRYARGRIDDFAAEIAAVEDRREAIVEKIGTKNEVLDHLHFDLYDAMEREERRRSEWLVEREPDLPAHRTQIMPWARGCEEDQRFRVSLGASMASTVALAMLVSTIALPLVERSRTADELPERVAKLVRRERRPPPPPVPIEEPLVAEVPEPEPDPEPQITEDLPPEPAVRTTKNEAGQAEPPEPVRAKGILAFRDSFANRAALRPGPQLGSRARVGNAGENSVGRPERMMVSTSAPGSSGGINLASISRDVGGGGGEIAGVEVAQVASSIGSGDGPDRPLAGGASAGRTDEEIQIVFDRYKASLYRLYNRELRKDPTLRGQLVLRLTIEPDGSVSLCELHNSDMDSATLATQVVQRVSTFDFGAKEDIVAVTIIYPIDFLPAA